MDYLRAYAESMGAGKMGGAGKGTAVDTIKEGDEEEDDEVPDLVENFEEAANK